MNIWEAATSLQVHAWEMLVWMERNGWIDKISTPTVFGISGRQDKVRAGYLVNVMKPRGNKKARAVIDITPTGVEVLRQLLPSTIRSGEV